VISSLAFDILVMILVMADLLLQATRSAWSTPAWITTLGA